MRGTKSSIKFEPSMKILSRILKVVSKENAIGRTALSEKANVNYTILSKHLEWLEDRSIVEMMVNDGKVNITLTSDGRDFAKKICSSSH